MELTLQSHNAISQGCCGSPAKHSATSLLSFTYQPQNGCYPLLRI